MEVFPAEAAISVYVEWIRLGIEVIGVCVVTLGILLAAGLFLKLLLRGHSSGFHEVRLVLARYLALGLEFQLASDIISTAIAPTWDRIGKLAAIAVIRTGLNFFLMREMEQESRKKSSAA